MTNKDHILLKLKIVYALLDLMIKQLIFEYLIPKYKYFLNFLCKK